MLAKNHPSACCDFVVLFFVVADEIRERAQVWECIIIASLSKKINRHQSRRRRVAAGGGSNHAILWAGEYKLIYMLSRLSLVHKYWCKRGREKWATVHTQRLHCTPTHHHHHPGRGEVPKVLFWFVFVNEIGERNRNGLARESVRPLCRVYRIDRLTWGREQ